MSLSPSTIELIFAKLSLAYGHRFLSIWDGTPLDVLKADWAQQLEGMREDRILWALQNLPERAPDAPTFRALCMRMPELREPMFRALREDKRPIPPAIRKELAALREKLHWKRAH